MTDTRITTRPPTPPGYVVYYAEHLRDGLEEHAKAFGSLKAALEFIAEVQDRFAGDNYSFRLFELGAEVPLKEEEIEEPQPSKKKRRYRV